MKVYKAKEKLANTNLILGIVAMAVGFLTLLLVGQAIIMLPAVLMIINGYFYKKSALVTLAADHMELKLGPIASTKLIRYTDLIALKEESKRKVILSAIVNGKQKELRMPMTFLTPEDKSDLESAINAKIAENKGKAELVV